MFDINQVKIKKLFNCDSWKDSAGSYSLLYAEIICNDEEKQVMFFVSSEYMNRLTVWDKWDCEFMEEEIFSDIDYHDILNQEILNIYYKLHANVNIGIKRNVKFNISDRQARMICFCFNKELDEVSDDELISMLDEMIRRKYMEVKEDIL